MVSGTTIGICIPTINQAQLLEESLEVLVAQHEHFAKIIVIDNGAQQISTRHPKLEILEQNENLGVAASWNLGLDSLFSDPSITHVLTINDDVALGANQLNVVIKLLDENPEKWFFSGQHQLSVWAMSRECYNVFHEADSEVFDQGFYPAYFEDKDFRHRLHHRDDTKMMN